MCMCLFVCEINKIIEKCQVNKYQSNIFVKLKKLSNKSLNICYIE